VALFAGLLGALTIGFAPCELVAAAGEFFDGAALFELIKHAEEGTGVRFPEMEGAGDVRDGSGVIANLKKTKDVVGAEV
jgi:hypothetical protein